MFWWSMLAAAQASKTFASTNFEKRLALKGWPSPILLLRSVASPNFQPLFALTQSHWREHYSYRLGKRATLNPSR
jgi:hypothetical protein